MEGIGIVEKRDTACKPAVHLLQNQTKSIYYETYCTHRRNASKHCTDHVHDRPAGIKRPTACIPGPQYFFGKKKPAAPPLQVAKKPPIWHEGFPEGYFQNAPQYLTCTSPQVQVFLCPENSQSRQYFPFHLKCCFNKKAFYFYIACHFLHLKSILIS